MRNPRGTIFYMKMILSQKFYICISVPLIEYNIRNIFLETSLDHKICFTRFVFILWRIEDYRDVLKLRCRPLAFSQKPVE